MEKKTKDTLMDEKHNKSYGLTIAFSNIFITRTFEFTCTTNFIFLFYLLIFFFFLVRLLLFIFAACSICVRFIVTIRNPTLWYEWEASSTFSSSYQQRKKNTRKSMNCTLKSQWNCLLLLLFYVCEIIQKLPCLQRLQYYIRCVGCAVEIWFKHKFLYPFCSTHSCFQKYQRKKSKKINWFSIVVENSMNQMNLCVIFIWCIHNTRKNDLILDIEVVKYTIAKYATHEILSLFLWKCSFFRNGIIIGFNSIYRINLGCFVVISAPRILWILFSFIWIMDFSVCNQQTLSTANHSQHHEKWFESIEQCRMLIHHFESISIWILIQTLYIVQRFHYHICYIDIISNSLRIVHVWTWCFHSFVYNEKQKM